MPKGCGQCQNHLDIFSIKSNIDVEISPFTRCTNLHCNLIASNNGTQVYVMTNGHYCFTTTMLIFVSRTMYTWYKKYHHLHLVIS